MLTERQEMVLQLVVDAHLESRKPGSSKAIAQQKGIEWSASTLRSELAVLERAGFLTHPHTSAGRLRGGAGAVQDAARGRRGDARDDRCAVKDDRPGGAGHRSTAGYRHHPS